MPHVPRGSPVLFDPFSVFQEETVEKQPKKKPAKMNIYNIAHEAGVSIATVSRVLNNSPSVSAKTKEKVLSVIGSHDYVPSAIAQNLSLRTSGNLIGIVCYNLQDLYYATAVSLLESSLRKRGHHIILSCTGEDYLQKQRSIEMLITKQVDAVILIGSVFLDEYGNNAYLVNAAKHCPLVIINGKVRSENIYSFYCDDFSAMRECVHEICPKHHNFLFLYDADTYSGNLKLTGFRQGMQECGLDPAGRTVRCGPTPDSAGAKFEEMYGVLQKIDAVIAANDMLAAGVLNAALRRGLRVPEDISVVGYNNSVITQCTTPHLSSVDNGLEQLCSLAVEGLTKLLQGETIEGITTISPRLVQRETI